MSKKNKNNKIDDSQLATLIGSVSLRENMAHSVYLIELLLSLVFKVFMCSKDEDCSFSTVAQIILLPVLLFALLKIMPRRSDQILPKIHTGLTNNENKRIGNDSADIPLQIVEAVPCISSVYTCSRLMPFPWSLLSGVAAFKAITVYVNVSAFSEAYVGDKKKEIIAQLNDNLSRLGCKFYDIQRDRRNPPDGMQTVVKLFKQGSVALKTGKINQQLQEILQLPDQYKIDVQAVSVDNTTVSGAEAAKLLAFVFRRVFPYATITVIRKQITLSFLNQHVLKIYNPDILKNIAEAYLSLCQSYADFSNRLVGLCNKDLSAISGRLTWKLHIGTIFIANKTVQCIVNLVLPIAGLPIDFVHQYYTYLEGIYGVDKVHYSPNKLILSAVADAFTEREPFCYQSEEKRCNRKIQSVSEQKDDDDFFVVPAQRVSNISVMPAWFTAVATNASTLFAQVQRPISDSQLVDTNTVLQFGAYGVYDQARDQETKLTGNQCFSPIKYLAPDTHNAYFAVIGGSLYNRNMQVIRQHIDLFNRANGDLTVSKLNSSGQLNFVKQRIKNGNISVFAKLKAGSSDCRLAATKSIKCTGLKVDSKQVVLLVFTHAVKHRDLDNNQGYSKCSEYSFPQDSMPQFNI